MDSFLGLQLLILSCTLWLKAHRVGAQIIFLPIKLLFWYFYEFDVPKSEHFSFSKFSVMCRCNTGLSLDLHAFLTLE